jgi:hypothetical protein
MAPSLGGRAGRPPQKLNLAGKLKVGRRRLRFVVPKEDARNQPVAARNVQREFKKLAAEARVIACSDLLRASHVWIVRPMRGFSCNTSAWRAWKSQ